MTPPALHLGRIAAFLCAATYLFGFALLLTLLKPLGYGTDALDGVAVVAFLEEGSGILILWNLTIYVLNAIALLCLVIVWRKWLHAETPLLADLTAAFGVLWATLVFGAGMITNIGVEEALRLAPVDPQAAAQRWETLHAVELGLGGGNEIAGALWIGLTSFGGWRTRKLGSLIAVGGLLVGLSGLATVLPPLGETAGALFGLGAIGWFLAVGISLGRKSRSDCRDLEIEQST